MTFHTSGSVRFYKFSTLDNLGVPHAIFTRHGGVSPDPWYSLNLGGTVGDDPVRVAKNREIAFNSVGRSLDTIFDVWQVHHVDVVKADAPRLPDSPHQKSDAIITDRTNVTLFMRFADCVPIMLYDPVRQAIALIHAGWPGTVKRVVQAAVEAMKDAYHSRPSDLLAALGPSIAAHHYEIGPDVEILVRNAFGSDATELLPTTHGKVQFDLWAANRLVLEACGVRQIEVAGLCTACNLENWYSHRGECGRTGRFGALIGLSGN